MSNFKPKNSRKRKYNHKFSSNCCTKNSKSSPVKISAQSTETWSSFLSNLSVDLPNSNIDKNIKLVSSKNKLLTTMDKLRPESFSASFTNMSHEENVANNSIYSLAIRTDNKISINESQSMLLDVKSKNTVKSLSPILSNNKEGMPNESCSEFLFNISQNVIHESSLKFSDKIIKTENYQNISCDMKFENEIKRDKHMKTKLNSDILSKSGYNSNENNENLSLIMKTENGINEANPNFLSHITSTPVKKSQIKQLENLSIPSDVNSSIVCTPCRSIRQKSSVNTEKTLKTFRGEMRMRNHMKTVHLYDEFPWKCSDCGTKFSGLLDFVSHKKVAHNKDVKNWTCYICGEMDELVYQCHYCKYVSASLVDYQNHLNRHKVNRSLIQCYHCDKSFSRRNAMMDHMRSFHRDEKLECKICGLKSTNLSLHIASVHIGAPKMCRICEQQYKNKRDLLEHQRKIHDAQPLGKCDICGVILPDYYYRKKHMLAHDKHVDENGQYLPLSESEIKKLDRIIKKRMNHSSRFVSAMCGSDEPIPSAIIDVAKQQANVLINSKMTDTSDFKFFLMLNDK